ncbi:hypothetical protein SEA_LAMBERT1_90 [Mycobacterium phage Lambert1]|nr:hypothetical protein PBI_QUINNKIRO_89 [Mycobacterium phage QuinnKiro]ALA11891.1 hypothetical protein SEA_TEXAGE_88 [Mycobacterium phage Texage]AOT24238.1 hypothetical protein SEA_TODACORO_90 [Mycobacterium phage Todacoro]AUX82385.1 hypothetical protein SEA_LAMBERT1_90 [Mycobacterium phage Lambert1]AWY03621.1 hypothetical protein SEA_HOOKMOUNT_90 [Mycobacterium phage Hookmount]AYR03468.1 hypothetical protein SEA_POPCICLE_90 [Mycobacterium phage Popcicle]UVK64131.1 hypothetical protein SEA_C
MSQQRTVYLDGKVYTIRGNNIVRVR